MTSHTHPAASPTVTPAFRAATSPPSSAPTLTREAMRTGSVAFAIPKVAEPTEADWDMANAIISTVRKPEVWSERGKEARLVAELLASARASARGWVVIEALLSREKQLAACMVGCSWAIGDNGGHRHLLDCPMVTQGFVDIDGNRMLLPPPPKGTP